MYSMSGIEYFDSKSDCVIVECHNRVYHYMRRLQDLHDKFNTHHNWPKDFVARGYRRWIYNYLKNQPNGVTLAKLEKIINIQASLVWLLGQLYSKQLIGFDIYFNYQKHFDHFEIRFFVITVESENDRYRYTNTLNYAMENFRTALRNFWKTIFKSLGLSK